MDLDGDFGIPSSQDFELMGIPLSERGAILVEELGDYTHIIAEKRRELLLSGDANVFAANSLMRTISDLRQPTAYNAQVLPLMNRWQQMGEEPPFTSA